MLILVCKKLKLRISEYLKRSALPKTGIVKFVVVIDDDFDFLVPKNTKHLRNCRHMPSTLSLLLFSKVGYSYTNLRHTFKKLYLSTHAHALQIPHFVRPTSHCPLPPPRHRRFSILVATVRHLIVFAINSPYNYRSKRSFGVGAYIYLVKICVPI